MNFGLSKDTIKQFRSVFQKNPDIEAVILYGSRAKGNYREGSDIDPTPMGKNLTDESLNKIMAELDNLNSPYLIDLSVFHLLESESLIEHIKRVGKEFYITENQNTQAGKGLA